MPTITSVSTVQPLAAQNIVISGSGFGTQAPFNGDLGCIEVSDLTANWNAGHYDLAPTPPGNGGACSAPQGGGADYVTIQVSSWTDTAITIAGFTGSYGSNNWILNPGDKVDFIVWNAQSGSGPNSYLTTVSGPQLSPIDGPVTYADQGAGGHNGCIPCLVGSAVNAVGSAVGAVANATRFPVETSTGDFWHTFSDLSVPGRGFPLAFTRTYNALSGSTTGPLGYGWTDSYNMFLTQAATSATIHQENGSAVTFTLSGGLYTAPGRDQATLVKNGDGSFTFTRDVKQILTFNPSGQLISEKDLNGYTTTLKYTATKLTKVTDPAGRSLSFTWSGIHIHKVTDPAGHAVTFSYDASGNLASGKDQGGKTTTFTYDSAHRMLTMTDPRGGVVTNTYDAQGRVATQTDQVSRLTTFAYAGDSHSATGGTTTVTDPKGNITVDTYQYGLLTSETKGAGTPEAATWTYRYDPVTIGRTSVTDPNGNTTSATYDAHSNLLTKTDGLGRTTTSTYNALNEPLTTTDPLGVTTTNTYDAAGNLLTTSTPLVGSSPAQVQTTTYTHGDATHPGDVTSMVDPAGKTSTFTYDTYGDQASSTDPLGDKTTHTFNKVGWVLATVSPRGNTSGAKAKAFTTKDAYDVFGEVTKTTDPLGHVSTKTYDADHNLATVTDPNGNITTYSHDLANEQITVKRADGTTTSTTYWPDGTVKAQIDGAGTAIQSYAYDSLGRVTSITDALGHTTSSTYDGTGNKLTKQDPGGNCAALPATGCTTMTYDAANELTSVTYSDGTTPNVTNITYDNDGQRTGLTDGTGTSTWVYDSLHRLVSYTNGAGATGSDIYDLRNLPTTITYPGAHDVTRAYDDAGRLTSVQDWSVTPNATTFTYDADSNVTKDTFTSGVVDTYTFNNADQMTAISDAKGATKVFSATYARDNNGQLASDSSQAPAQGAYKYTGLNQLCYAGSTSTTACAPPPAGSYPYTNSAADNLTTMESATHTATNTQQFNAADELCWTVAGANSNACGTAPTGATSFTYDTRGNQTAAVPSTGSATCDGYDQADRLISIQTGTGATCTTPTPVATYAYDGTGLRMTKTVGGTTSQFTWNESSGLPMLLQEQAGAATPTSYIYGPGGLPVEMISSGGSAYFYAHDQLGSTRALTDTSGAVQATDTYDPYGNVVTRSGAAPNPLQFAGQYKDAESGLYYLRARYYQPTTGQFLTRDPIVATTHRSYGYGAGNPLSFTDPSGQCVNGDGPYVAGDGPCPPPAPMPGPFGTCPTQDCVNAITNPNMSAPAGSCSALGAGYSVCSPGMGWHSPLVQPVWLGGRVCYGNWLYSSCVSIPTDPVTGLPQEKFYGPGNNSLFGTCETATGPQFGLLEYNLQAGGSDPQEHGPAGEEREWELFWAKIESAE